MTDREKSIVSAYTGITMLSGEKFQIFHKYIEDILCRPVYTHELAVGAVWQEIKEKSKDDFIEICKREDGWIPVSERLPEDFGTYLITLEGGDVCKCEFNPDFIDEEHENGAFTYYHEYFDPATLGLIDGEEEVVDAIAWMPFEPYKAEGSGE